MVETGDDTSEQVLATMQALLKQGKQPEAAADRLQPSELPENVSPIDAMKVPKPPNREA